MTETTPEKPKKTKKPRERTIWDECREYERRLSELMRQERVLEAKLARVRAKKLELINSASAEVKAHCEKK